MDIDPSSPTVFEVEYTIGKLVNYSGASIAAASSGTRAYLVEGDDTLYAFDLEMKTMTKMDISGTAIAVALSGDARFAYVLTRNPDSVVVVDTSKGTVTKQISVPNALAIAVTADQGWVYVTNTLTSSVTVIDALDNVVRATLPVGHVPNAIAFAQLAAPPQQAQSSNAGGGGCSLTLSRARNGTGEGRLPRRV